MTARPDAFPLQGSPDLPAVPWAIAEPARAALHRAIGLPLEALARRGGVTAPVLLAALRGVPPERAGRVGREEAEAALGRIVGQGEGRR